MEEVLLDNSYTVTKVIDGLMIPWGMAFSDADTLLVTERTGNLVQVTLSEQTKTTLYSVNNLYAKGQGGLMDIAQSPEDANRYYFTYSDKTDKGATTSLATATISNGKLSNWTRLLKANADSDSGRHFGSRITFDDKGHLYFGIGDRGDRDNGQDTSNHAAAILRLNLDGSVPTDNPFVNDNKVANEIWSYGHRNPQGLFFDKATDSLWEIEHGPRGGDEINLIGKGLNYGWAKTSHGKEYWGPLTVGEAKTLPGIEQPKWVYIPSIAPGSLILYRGEHYPQLNGKLLSGALKLAHINVVDIQGDQLKEQLRLVTDLGERVRDIAISPDGLIYFSTDNGNIYRLEPKPK
ncbi:PQQ-dependent sugar dehydrogenase [Vibrio hippocampi]|nr:PQQ-dependent sugar dehydrogenase [Vibrio hippocampi]